MTTAPLKLKYPNGWFAAGRQIEKALTLLPDGPFKLFVYLCLQARRETGSLETTQNHLAKSLHKSRRSVGSYLQQLHQAGICRSQMSHNPHTPGLIEINDPYWPYHRGSEGPTLEEESAYVAEVKKHFLARPCVRSSFSLADGRLAQDWFQQGIALEQIQHTLLLGCTRKYVTWRNGHNRAPIASLRYFEPILSEVVAAKVGPQYWDYLRSRLERLEKWWLERQPARPSTTDSLGHRQPTLPVGQRQRPAEPISLQTPRASVQESWRGPDATCAKFAQLTPEKQKGDDVDEIIPPRSY